MQKIQNCQKCNNNFTIESEDFAFYEKIQVPPPTFCPECRLIRRMTHSNELSLYKRVCDLTGKDIITVYDKNAPFPVYDYEAWNTDAWDPYEYGLDVDFSKPFFEQLLELKSKVPKPSLVKQGMFVNSEYVNRVSDAKNCYMVFRATDNQDLMYTYISYESRECVDCLDIFGCELCYDCISCRSCYNVKYSQDSIDCRDSAFLFACSNCSDCFGCVNLRNKKYCIWNEQYTKEEYQEKLRAIDISQRSNVQMYKKKFADFVLEHPHKFMSGTQNNNVSGNWINNSKNTHHSFFCTNTEDGKYLFNILDSKDCMDYFHWGRGSELMYEVANTGINCSQVYFSSESWSSSSFIEYCDNCPSSKYCFGCVGVRNGEYTILNKKYSKEEYFSMMEKIKQHMHDMPYIDSNDIVYRYGEFFPSSLSPFAYNETAAQEFFPLSKEEAMRRGYTWKDIEKNKYTTTYDAADLPETTAEVDDAITNEIISCADSESPFSKGAFKITFQELQLYRKMNIPLPVYSFPVRHMNRMKKLTPIKLYPRTTADGIDVMTAYAPDRPEIILSEEGYQNEVM